MIATARDESGQKWSSPKYLTPGWLGAGGVRTIATEGDTVHLLVWDSGLHYVRSEDAGNSWGPKTCLAETSGAQVHPSIHRLGSKLHVTWQDGRNGSGEPYSWRICYKRSEDCGQTWSDDVLVSSAEAESFRHASAVSGSTIHEVWSDKRHNSMPNAFSTDGNWEIYYKRSLDEGQTWGPDIRLTNMESMVCQRPAIGVVDDTVFVAFIACEERGRGILDMAFGDIYSIQSTDGGATWGPVVRFTDTPYQSMHPQVVAAEPGIFGVIWEAGRSYDFEAGEWRGPAELLDGQDQGKVGRLLRLLSRRWTCVGSPGMPNHRWRMDGRASRSNDRSRHRDDASQRTG